MGSLLILLFVVIFGIAFGVAAVMLRTPADQRQVERRLDLVLPFAHSNMGAQPEALLREEKATASGQLVVWAEGLTPVRQLRRLLYQSTGSRDMGPTLLAITIAFLLGVIGVDLATDMVPLATVAGVLFGVLPIARLHRMRQQKLRAFEASLPDCIDMCARALRAGHSLISAIGMVAEEAAEPARTEFAEIFKKQNFGLPLRDVLLDTLERVPSADLRVFATGIFVQKDTGGNLTEIFDRIVLVIRERLRIQGEIRVHTAQGRLTAWILTLLPVALLAIINLLDPGYSRPMFHDALGQKLMYAGAVLLLIGGFTVRQIVNGIEV